MIEVLWFLIEWMARSVPSVEAGGMNSRVVRTIKSPATQRTMESAFKSSPTTSTETVFLARWSGLGI